MLAAVQWLTVFSRQWNNARSAREAPSLSRAAQQQWLQQIDLTLRTQGQSAAAGLAVQAMAAGVAHPAVLNLAAQAYHAANRLDEAVAILKRARKLAPKDPHVLNSLGICEQARGGREAALEAFSAAARADPQMAHAHCNRGDLLKELGLINPAREAFAAAVGIEPDFVEALSSLAWLEAEAGNLETAKHYGERACKVAPANVLANMALAAVDLQEKRLAEAAERLSGLAQDPSLSPLNRSIVLGMTGDLQDALGKPSEAFRYYTNGNETLKALNATTFEGPAIETALAQAIRLREWFETAEPGPWREAEHLRPRAADPKAHIFLIGFPRSGTTLLESVLAAHPEVVSLEEKGCLEKVAEPYLASHEGLLRLAALPSGEAMRQRNAYWACVRANGVEPRGKFFIDKFPLSSVQLPVIAKLFPNARILFAQRDPRDVVLSCFRRRFGLNPAMYQLLTLEGAAAFYDAVMRLSSLYAEIFRLPRHIVRYEKLVEDFEHTARAVCDFIGIEWTADMLEFAEKAKARGISTPSAAQVARGLNRDGQGAWRRYEAQMAPVLPMLEPWVRTFGYEAS